jgi:predicted HTH domain antitoxin
MSFAENINDMSVSIKDFIETDMNLALKISIFREKFICIEKII